MLTQLDQATDTELETIQLRYATADEMMRTLQALDSSRRSKGGEAPEDLSAAIVADERTNSLIVSGNAGYRERIRGLVAKLDREVKDRRDVHVVALRYAKAVDLAPIIEQLASERVDVAGGAAPEGGAAGSPAAVSGKVTVQPDEQTNSLIITARPDLFRDMKAVIDRLDVRRAQVLVEALIVEFNEDKAAELGIQWFAVQDDVDIDVGEVIGDVASQTLSSGTAVGVLSSSDWAFGALARALDQDADANILSTPSLLTLDNEEAEIIVGQQVPFVTGSYSSVGDSNTVANPFQTIQRENVGLTLKITPQINEGDAIRLTIDQEVSAILPGAADIINSVDVVTSLRSIKTNVIVDDGGILVLGGLIDDQVREAESRLPILGDIPVLGAAFRYRDSQIQKRNLMIFIRPQILRSDAANLVATEGTYNDLRQLQVERYKKGVKLLPEATQPVMPALDAQGQPLDGPPVLPETGSSDGSAESTAFDIQNYDL